MNLSHITDIFHYGIIQRAVLIGLLVGASCSLLSVYVVLRRMAFIGQGISHSAFGGIALGLLILGSASHLTWGINLITAVFCITVAVLIGIISRQGRISEDSVIGVFFSISMALGIVFIGLRKQYSPEVFTYLFGNILSVTTADVVIEAVLSLIIIGCILFLNKELQAFVFSEELARAAGIPVEFLRYLLLVLLSLTIVISVKIIGIVLISAFLVIPGATAHLLARSFKSMMLISLIFGMTTSLVGLLISNIIGLPSGAMVVITQFVVFVSALFVKKHLA